MSIEEQVDEIFNDAGKLQKMLDWLDGPESDGCIKTDVILAMTRCDNDIHVESIKNWVHEGIKNMENSFFAGLLSGMIVWENDVFDILYNSAEQYLEAINGQ